MVPPPTHDALPAGWPIFEPGLAMTVTDRVLVVHLDERLTPAAFARYIDAWKRSVDGRPPEARVGAFYHVPSWAGFTAGMRREWGQMLKSREDKLRATTAGMALVTPSLLVRGALRAVFWMAPPPYPHDVVDTNEAAFAFLRPKIPLLDVPRALADVEALLKRYRSEMLARGR